jgi:hypothetical protein
MVLLGVRIRRRVHIASKNIDTTALEGGSKIAVAPSAGWPLGQRIVNCVEWEVATSTWALPQATSENSHGSDEAANQHLRLKVICIGYMTESNALSFRSITDSNGIRNYVTSLS